MINNVSVEYDNNHSKSSFMVMYHGAVMPGRDVERLIELLAINMNIKAVVLGNASDAYKDKLKTLVKEYNVDDRILFHRAVPLKELWKYVGAVDVGLILARATCKNHLYSLPNKFFENIQAETPVICPDYPAFKQLVMKYENGLLCNPDDLSDVNRCIEMLRTDKELYSKLKKNTVLAKEELNWEIEKRELVRVYMNMQE